MMTPVNKETSLYKCALHVMHNFWGTKGVIFPGSQPVSIEYRHFDILKSNPYVVCEKTDGVRFMLIAIMFEGKKKVIFVNRAFDMFECKLNFKKPFHKNVSIIEGELCGDTFLAFDCIVGCGDHVGSKNLLDRYDVLEKSLNMLVPMTTDSIKIKLKTYHPMTNYKYFVDEYLPKVTQKTDGLIFTPVNEPLKVGTHETMFKWKPRDMNTIDFQFKKYKHLWRLYVQEKGVLVMESELPEVPDWIQENDIVECQYMFDDSPMWWKPLKKRPDKTFPNGRRTFYRTLVNIREDIKINDFFDCIPIHDE